MMIRLRSRLRILVCCAIVGIGSAGTARAVGPGPVQFPLLGIGRGQTLRLSALAVQPGPINCDATLGFADRAGALLINPGPIQISLAPGESAFLDVRFGLVGLGRFEVRPMVTFPAGSDGSSCQVSVEIFDQASGYGTVFVSPGPIQLPVIQPGPVQTFSPLGLGFGQVAQINATWVNPGPIQLPSIAADADAGPCLVTLSFVDASGSPVGTQPGPIQIGAGQTASDYFLALPPTVGPRVNVRPVVALDSVPGMAACPGVVAAVETFDVFTGRTWVVVNPGPSQ
jgi:hypothetical protein